MTMKRANRGFTLIELMIVIGILAILLTIGIPAYAEYSVRARIAEGLAAMMPAKTAVSEYTFIEGSLPTSAASAGLSSVETKYVEGLSLNTSGAIMVDFDEAEVGAPGGVIQLVLEPTVAGNAIVWNCTASGTDASNLIYVPSGCKS
jgi:type IV pilus assembly protein PilA